MRRSNAWAGLLSALLLLMCAEAASAQQGCEYTSQIDFFTSLVEPNSDCRWSSQREVYECGRQGVPSWDLKVFSPEPGYGRTVAYRDDGFAIIYGCSCDNACSFYSPGALSGRAGPIEPGNWICTEGASRYSEFSQDLWGATCTSQGGMFAQVIGVNNYQAGSNWWLFVFDGDEGDPGCLGKLTCSVTFQEPGGPPRQRYFGRGETGFHLDYNVQSLELQCVCEQP